MKNNVILLTASILFILAFIGPINAANTISGNDQIYVNGSSGNDSWDGQSWNTAKLTIKNATYTVNNNGTVNIANGNYTGSGNRDITINKNMTICGQSQSGTIIDANYNNDKQIFYIQSGLNITLLNLTL